MITTAAYCRSIRIAWNWLGHTTGVTDMSDEPATAADVLRDLLIELSDFALHTSEVAGITALGADRANRIMASLLPIQREIITAWGECSALGLG
jgi:hypothetical protein